MKQRQTSLAQFYSDPQRQRSYERSFGYFWLDDELGYCQVTWLRDTGELVAISARSGGQVSIDGGVTEMLADVVLGTFMDRVSRRFSKSEGASEVELLGVVHDEKLLNDLLAGWEEREETGKGLNWVRKRLGDSFHEGPVSPGMRHRAY